MLYKLEFCSLSDLLLPQIVNCQGRINFQYAFGIILYILLESFSVSVHILTLPSFFLFVLPGLNSVVLAEQRFTLGKASDLFVQIHRL